VEKLKVCSDICGLRADKLLSRMLLAKVDSIREIFPAIKSVHVCTYYGNLPTTNQADNARILGGKVRLGERMKGGSGSEVAVFLKACGGDCV
jgi:hypothetical protein